MDVLSTSSGRLWTALDKRMDVAQTSEFVDPAPYRQYHMDNSDDTNFKTRFCAHGSNDVRWNADLNRRRSHSLRWRLSSL